MSNGCVYVISKETQNTEFYKQLTKKFANNDNKIIEYFVQVATNKGFKDDFKNWYRIKTGTTDVLTFENVTASVMDSIIDYCNRNNPDGHKTVMQEYKPNAAKYRSAGDRNFCINQTRISIKDEAFFNRNKSDNKDKYTYYDWTAIATEKVLYALYKRILATKGLTEADIDSKFNKERRKGIFDYLFRDEDGPKLTKERAIAMSKNIEYLNIFKEILGDDMNYQDKNVYALLDEMLDFHKRIDGVFVNEAFFDEVFNDPELRKLKIKSSPIENTENDLAAASVAILDGVNVDEGTVAIELYNDETIKEYNIHDGQHPTFMMHLSDNIINYFNSLPILKSTRHYSNDTYDYDIDNPTGFASHMNARQCAMMLYGRARTDGNIEQFIESIREIAERNPGYEGFIKLYYDLKGYNKDIKDSSTGEVESVKIEPLYHFAEELFDVFAKTAVAKKEIYIDKDGNLKARITNQATSPKDSFRLQCINSLKSSATRVIQGEALTRFASINEKLDTLTINLDRRNIIKGSEEYRAARRALIDLICDTYKWYFPNITLGAVLSYVDNQEHQTSTGTLVIDDMYNIKKLINVLNDVIEKAQATKEKYEKRSSDAANAKYQNSLLDEAKDVDPTIDDSSRIDIDAIYAEDYMDPGTVDAARTVADELLLYSNVKTQFNSRNAAGNNSSDILNNNMLTYLKHIVEHRDNTQSNKLSPLNMFGRYKFHYGKNRQYDGSNLLVEHKDKDGNIINLGLFRKVSRKDAIVGDIITTYEPTEYAKDLLKITLFNGTSDVIRNKAALYANMSKGDYIISAITSFFNTNYDAVNAFGKKFNVAEYYLRTPSDAPKNFFLTLPKYSVDGLFVVNDKQQITDEINYKLSNIPVTDKRLGGEKYHLVKDDVIFNLLIGNDVPRIYIEKGEYKRKDDDNAYVTIKNGNTQVVVEGEFVDSPKNKYIENIKVIGVLQNKNNNLDETLKTKIINYYTEQLSNSLMPLHDGSFVNRHINRNHPIFKQMFNVALQEVTDAATAARTLFKEISRKDGNELVTCFIDDNGDLNWSDTFAKYDDPENMTEEIYHHDKGKPVFYKNDKGIVVLTGKVFSSDRFTKFSNIFDDKEEKYKPINDNYLKDLFADGPASEEDGRIHILYGGYNTHLHYDQNGNVELTKAQEDYISDRIEKFIIDYAGATYERVNEFSNLFREGTPHDYNNISEFILNYRLAYYACADLLEGDSKCYKSFTDFLKRAKEVQGAGNPYSALDYTKEICGNRELIKYSSLNSNKKIEELINSGKLHDAKLYTVFRGVTVKNTVRTPEGTQTWIKDNLIQVIKNSYKENGIVVNNDKIEARAASIMTGFEDVKTNDAQSYITFEEWIRRISMRGQLPKYLPLIERICDESKPLTINDIDEFIQVQKNFYYDQYYDERLNHMRPRQIKNAEFVLVPRLVKGTQLEQVYKTMIDNGIDQLNTVETSKAGKSNILTLWDNNGNLTDNWFSNKDSDKLAIKNAVEIYDYNFLYTQQETPQHVNDENKAAIQLMKRVVDNIPQYINGKEHPLWKYKQRFQKLYSQNIKESNSNLLERLNVKYDKNGNFSISDKDGIIGLDANVFCDMMKDELLRQAQDNDMLDYVTLNTSPVEEILTSNGFGLDTKMPIIANNAVRSKFESVAQALFNNNITRQTLPGFHAAQITGIGWKNTDNVEYNLMSHIKDTKLKSKLNAKAWAKLSSEDRVKYIPNNGIGVANDLAYHPAIYKNEKTGKTIEEKDYLNLTEKEKQNYKLNSAATYIEVRVPKSVFNFEYYKKDKNKDNLRLKTDIELLEELRFAHLDEFVGYRIPTEGKQSMAIMKIVGFVDDAYGSTIVVPDGWVAQTGSDFDIDSVYSVIFNNKTNPITNKIEKIKYLTKFDYNSYISYIYRRSDNKISKRKNIKEEKQNLIDKINTLRSDDYYLAYNEESIAYDKLEDNVKKIIKTAQQLKGAGKTRLDFAIERGNSVISALNKFIEEHDLNPEEKNDIENYIAAREKLIEAMTSDKYKEQLKEDLNAFNETILKEIEEQAKKLNLPTYEEYSKLGEIEKNSKKARSNALLETMLDILRSDWSLEENLSQSNFREVIGARDRILESNPAAKIQKEARSPYDFMDQADNMEEAISGRSLKGISVAYDNLVSIFNTARPYLTENNEITVIYPITKVRKLKNGKQETIKLDIATLSRRFDEFEEDENGNEILDANGNPRIKKQNVKVLKTEDGKSTGKVAITHTRFGWSNDNRNIDDFLITIYGSQTTAHQLDIIKEGAIPNVNNYTFTIYKLFPAIGSDYDTAVAFMMQPGITEIVKAYNKSKSIYSNRYDDPIRSAIISLAKKGNPNVQYYEESVEYLENLIKNSNKENILDYEKLNNRLNIKNDIAFDYKVIKKFKELKEISDKINAFSFVINPDKYGAKQTIFATTEVLNKMKDIILDENQVFTYVKNAKGNKVHVLEAIFPGINNYVAPENENDNRLSLDRYLANADDEASIYAPLHYMFKYSTIPSILVNRRLFQTQDVRFRNIVDSIKNVMSGKNPTLSEDTEDSFTSYIISYIVNEIPIISQPIDYDYETGIINPPKEPRGTLHERARIYGFFEHGFGANFRLKENDDWIDFNPLDKTNPSQKDVIKFMRFTPAQKAAYVQQHFSDSLACKYLKINLTVHNKYDKRNPDGQSIIFDEELEDINNVREEFREMFMNENPLLRLTAMDLIKYAYVVEGRSRARNTVGKMIPNSILIESTEKKGTGIVDALKLSWTNKIENSSEETAKALIESYVRSHSNMSEISQCTFSDRDIKEYFSGKNKIGDMLMIFDTQNTRDFILNKGIGFENTRETNTGEKETYIEPNKYINVTTYKNGKQIQTLYKIVEGLTTKQFILYPLNKLEENEFNKYQSANTANNRFYFSAFYDRFINLWKENSNGMGIRDYYISKVDDETKKKYTTKDTTLVGSLKVDLGDIYKETDKALYRVVSKINEHFNGFNTNTLYMQDSELSKRIKKPGSYKHIDVNGIRYRITKMKAEAFEDYVHSDKSAKGTELESIVNQIRSYGGHDFSEVYMIVPLRVTNIQTDTHSSTVIEKPLISCANDAQALIAKLAKEGNVNAMKTHKININNGVFRDDISPKDRLVKSLVNTRDWVKKEVELLLNGDDVRRGINVFWKDEETGKYLKMTDPKVFAAMLNDPSNGKYNPILHRAFLKTYLDALRLIETFESFDYSVYTDENKNLKIYVDGIKKEINRLKDNETFKEAERLYVTEHLAKVSKNPNIQQNIISLLEGYHTTSFLSAHIDDLQDTNNPIIQLVTKQVMADIRAKEMQADALAQDFEAKAKAIIDKANAAGMPINFDKLIDANGNWIEEFNEQFRNDIRDLYNIMEDAHNEYNKSNDTKLEKAELFEKYLQAKYNYEAFLLKNVNREIEDNYYHEVLQNIDSMRYQNGKFLEIYVEYEMLSDRKRALYKLADSDGGIDNAIYKEINEIERIIKNLVAPGFIDEFDDFISKSEFEETGDPDRDRIRKINSKSQADRLNSYLTNKESIQLEYIDREERKSFREILEHYLQIINRKEDRDPITNLPRRDETELSTDEEYTRAKAWLRENAIYKYGLDKRELDNMTYGEATNLLNRYLKGDIAETSKEFRKVIGAATVYFRNVKGSQSDTKAIYKQLARERDARDSDGVIDARKFTKEDIDIIRKEQLSRMGLSEDGDINEKAILHNSTDNVTMYKKKFYTEMRVQGITNPRYQQLVNNINSILRKALIDSKGIIDTASVLTVDDLTNLLKQLTILKYNLNDDDVANLNGIELLNLINSISTIDTEDELKHKLGVNKALAKKAAIFIKNHVDLKPTDEDLKEFNRQKAIAQNRFGKENGEDSLFYKLWLAVNEEWDENSGDNGDYVPNHLLWGNAKPKEGEDFNEYFDARKTAAMKVMRYTYSSRNSKYYEAIQAELISKFGINSPQYKKWFEKNHIYNPNTHKYEPLVCWTVHIVNNNIEGEWVPTYDMTTTHIREEHKNKKYKPGLGYINNYKNSKDRDEQSQNGVNNFSKRVLKTTKAKFDDATRPDGTYDRQLNLTSYEQDIKDLFKETLTPLAKNSDSKKYLETKLPVRANSKIADKPTWLTEIAKTFGLVDSNRKVYWDGETGISYNSDYVPPMPMMHQLTNKNTVNEPTRNEFKSDEEYEKALQDYKDHKAEIDKKNEEIHKSLIDKDWVSVIKEFIRQAGHYNAIQDNKYQLYFGQLLLNDIKNYVPRSDNPNRLKKKGSLGTNNEPNYLTKKDDLLINQYNNWLHRVIFDHYKQAQGKWERVGNVLQGFTSASYMTLNARAGIANVLVGDTNILAETFAKENFGVKNWFISKKLWSYSIMDYLAHAYDDKADTKVGAVIKGFNIIDYSELNGRITQMDLKKWSQIVTDLGFSFNNAGEHMMQNGVMIAMMLSHKVIENPNYGKPGERKYIVVNFEEYTQHVREDILREVGTKEQLEEYDKFVANIKKDPNGAKNFAWYREEPVSKFIAYNFSKEQRKEFKEKVKARKEEMNKVFREAKTVFDQLDKSEDGYMIFAHGSIFEQLNHIEPGEELSEAYRLLGEFKGRVISVNKKIHGNYGKLDSAAIEKFWIGRLLMQYHKHIPTGILKRYRRQGYFNEERGTVEKGMFRSLDDFLKFPVEAMRARGEIANDEAQALTGLQNLFHSIGDYFRYLAVYSDVMPEYDRANIRRMLANITAMLFAVGGAIGLKIAWDDEKEKKSTAFNLLMYEMDRLASETFMWNPYGAFNEAKKQWSSPIAAMSILSDCQKIMATITGIIFEGDDYDPYYHTGQYAGRHKLSVYFERRIPYYRNYAALRDIAESNHYYRIGENVFTLVPIKDIAEAIEGK